MLWGDLSTPEMKKMQKKESFLPPPERNFLILGAMSKLLKALRSSLESDFTESVEIVGNGKVFQIGGPQSHLTRFAKSFRIALSCHIHSPDSAFDGGCRVQGGVGDRDQHLPHITFAACFVAPLAVPAFVLLAEAGVERIFDEPQSPFVP